MSVRENFCHNYSLYFPRVKNPHDRAKIEELQIQAIKAALKEADEHPEELIPHEEIVAYWKKKHTCLVA